MQNLHLIKIIYLPATNTQGTRIKLKSSRFPKSKSITLQRDYSTNQPKDQAEAYLKSKGFNLLGFAEVDSNQDAILTNTFKELI